VGEIFDVALTSLLPAVLPGVATATAVHTLAACAKPTHLLSDTPSPSVPLRKLIFGRPPSLLDEFHYIPPNLKVVGVVFAHTNSLCARNYPAASKRMAPSKLIASQIMELARENISITSAETDESCQTGSCITVRGSALAVAMWRPPLSSKCLVLAVPATWYYTLHL
jgi:hypothetical protein